MARQPAQAQAQVERYFDKNAARYDRQMAFFERHVLGQHRRWATSSASGEVLELAVGTGLNLGLYPAAVTDVIGVELSQQMLARARDRIEAEGMVKRSVRQGDVQHLDFAEARFDTVVSTYTMCTIPDPAATLAEAYRVLRAGGRLVLVEHGPARQRLVLTGQRLVNPLSVRFQADSMLRDPEALARAAGFQILESDRLGWAGMVFRVLASKPFSGTATNR